MFPVRADGAVEEKAARSGLFVRISPGFTGPVERSLRSWRGFLRGRALRLGGWGLRGQSLVDRAFRDRPLRGLFRMFCGLLHRRLLRRQLAALGDDERRHLDSDVGEELDRHRVATPLPYRL